MHAARWFRRAAAVLTLSGAALAQTLGIGDPAPKLRVSSWVQGPAVAEFEREHVYVVDLWATWCLPCRKTIPFLTEVQLRHAAEKVRVIGVSVREDLQTEVAPFVKKMGEKMSYAVALDHLLEGAAPDQGSMWLAWMKASGEAMLPTTFIVDRAGKIAWIGDTLSLERPLQQIVAGTWNLDTARAEHQKRSKVNTLRRTLTDQIRAKQWEKALATIDQMLALAPEAEAKTAAWRFNALLRLGRTPEAYEYAKRCCQGLIKEDPYALNVVAWAIVDPEAARAEVRDLDFALEVAERAVKLTEGKHAGILDTLALIHFERGSVAQAIEIQTKAVELAKGTEYFQELAARLEKFKAAQKSPEEQHSEGGRLVTNGR
jgi:thiol-disulfide isomerase/thioredoxin